MTWVCDIPGAAAGTVTLHSWTHLGLATFVVVVGTIFLILAVISYRRSAPLPPSLAGES